MDDEYERRMSQIGGGGKKRPSKGNFRSSIYGGGMRRQSQVATAVNDDGGGWEDSNGAPVKPGGAKQDHRKSTRRSSITDSGRSIARRASNIIAHPLKALGEIVEASVQNSVIGAANSRAHQVALLLMLFFIYIFKTFKILLCMFVFVCKFVFF